MAQKLALQIPLLRRLKADTIARVLCIPETWVHAYFDAEVDALEKIEEHYYKEEMPKVQKAVQELIESIPSDERREMRRRYLLERIREVKQKYLETQNEELKKELEKMLFETRVYFGDEKGISVTELMRARAYPIERLIKHRNYTAHCPFHDDKTPSLNIKNNFYFCHGCGEHGDVIDFIMKTENLTFRFAVQRLNQL